MESQKPVTLLFVDDDTSYMAVAQHLLSKHQARRFTILWRQTGSAALELLATNPPVDMLLIDYYLPEMNGLEVVKAIRAKGVDLPIIFLTSNRDFRLAIEAMKYGVEDYLVKDEAVDSVLPRTILNIIERVSLKGRILEQQRADLLARKRADAIKELVVTVCHEFNNPLAAVKISTDILLRQPLPDQEARQVRELDKNIARVEKEISRLRDLNFEAIEPRKLR